MLAGLVFSLSAAAGGAPAPQQPFETLQGNTASLADYRGQMVVLNLWATWCSPCLIEIPHLVDLQPRIEPKGATIIGLALDSGSARAIDHFWRNTLDIEPNYPLWMGTVEQAAELFGAHTFPQTLLIDRHGRVRERLVGLQTEDDLWQALLPYLQTAPET